MIKKLMIGCSLAVLSVYSLSAGTPGVEEGANTTAPARTPKQGLLGILPFRVEGEMAPHFSPQLLIDLYVHAPSADNPTYSWSNTVGPEDVMSAYIQLKREAAERLPMSNTKRTALTRIRLIEGWQDYIDYDVPQNLKGPLVQALLPLINSDAPVSSSRYEGVARSLLWSLINFRTGIPVSDPSIFQPFSAIEDDTFTLAQFNDLMARVNVFNTLREELLPEGLKDPYIAMCIQEEALSVGPDELQRRVEAIQSERNTLFNKFAEENPNTKGALIRWALRLTPDEIHERVANYQDELNDSGIDPDSWQAARLMMFSLGGNYPQ